MKSVLITGGTGSAGRAFASNLLNDDNVGKIIIFSRDEQKQEQMERDFSVIDSKQKLRFHLGCIRDFLRIKMAMRNVDVVIHAAAMKIVPKSEIDPSECIKTNIIGTDNVVHAAIENGVNKAMILSTDKAAFSNTLYGSTKHCAERLFISANNYYGTKFSCSRYGNIIGSRGSVVELFKKLRDAGASYFPITHADMTRFWMDIEDAVSFVITSIDLMKGGEVFVPKLTPRYIVDVAKHIAPNIPHKYIGVRPGEKMHEILITSDEARHTVDIGDRYVIKPTAPFWSGADYLFNARPVPHDFVYSSSSAERE